MKGSHLASGSLIHGSESAKTGAVMEPLEPGPESRRLHGHSRHRRPWWKRKRLWITVVAIAVAIFVSLWLISSLHPPHEVD
jgi:hypothetical protein